MRQLNVRRPAERGVWVAPYQGENGEMILVAVRRDGRRIAERLLVPGSDHVGIAYELWGLVDAEDPEPMLKVI